MWFKPRLGVSTWTMGGLPLTEKLKVISSLGYEGAVIDIAAPIDSEEFFPTALSQHNLALFGVFPGDVDLANPDTAVRERAIHSYLQIIRWAKLTGDSFIICRPFKGRIRAVTSRIEEMQLLRASIRTIAHAANEKGLRLVFEVLNRYETHLVNNCSDALALLDSLALDNLGLYLNAFHMNIEEQDAAATLRQVGDRLWMYAMSDSNRQAIGHGHLKLGAHLWAMEDIKYTGPIIIECLPPGSNPFAPSADEEAIESLKSTLRDTRSWF